MGGKDPLPVTANAAAIVAALVARARAAQAAFDAATQDEVDEVVTAAGWAIVDPEHNRALAELAVRDTGTGQRQRQDDARTAARRWGCCATSRGASRSA